MDTRLFQPNCTVAEVLKMDSHLYKVFLRNNTACVGCYLAGFCTLRDVAVTYGLDLNLFLSQLQEAVPSNLPITKKELENEKRV